MNRYRVCVDDHGRGFTPVICVRGSSPDEPYPEQDQFRRKADKDHSRHDAPLSLSPCTPIRCTRECQRSSLPPSARPTRLDVKDQFLLLAPRPNFQKDRHTMALGLLSCCTHCVIIHVAERQWETGSTQHQAHPRQSPSPSEGSGTVTPLQRIMHRTFIL